MRSAVFKDRVRELRTERFGTQEKFAFRADVSRATVQNWERGTQLPSIEVAAGLADLLGVSLDYLAGLSDDPRPPPATQRAAEPQVEAQRAAEATPPQPPHRTRPRQSRKEAD